MNVRFQNKIVIITGGANGIGKAAATKFKSEGANVIIWDNNETQCQQTANELSIDFNVIDIRDATQVECCMQLVLQKFGTIDILINNAGITRDATLQKMSHAQWQDVIDINLTGVFNCTKAISPIMIGNKSGKIINTSSVVALYGNFGQTNYVASKSGVIGLTKVWARELGKYNINVNAVAPGFIETDMLKTIPENILKDILEKVPLKRAGKPEDIANAYAFLASDEAGFINGITLSVDGGMVS
jgi:3-oxoacyl-[acyl-carrier protein] reductase